ncbi:LysR family transcriptional regulator [Comamonas composti]|uniref:LysR family transcriptional regulator n=1 Tax=Comamonas composti TaxID=408558 RepID=UPI0003FFF783|nr:LysR substrate-binding domain-containing protein [Comamonas composti]
MHFDLIDLQLFAHVLDAGSITGAAGRSHMTLASASERIRAMEDSLGCALLTRGARGVQPTPAGHALGQHARAMLLQMHKLRGDMADYGAGLAGHVRVCGNTSAVSQHLPPALASFLRDHPRIALELCEYSSANVLERLRQGLCDIGVASDALDARGLHITPWRSDALQVVLARGHRLARRARLRLEDLLHEDWVGLPRGSALQSLVQQQARLLGADLRWRAQLQHLDSICEFVAQGVGVAVVPAAAAARLAPLHGLKALPLIDTWAQRQLLLCTADPPQLAAHAAQLLTHLQAWADV